MITDPLPDDLFHAALSRLARGFSHLSNTHLAVPGLSCVGVEPAASRLAARPSPAYSTPWRGTHGMRLSLTLSRGVP